VDIFSSGGGEKTARDFDLPFLGKVPMDPRVVVGGDSGRPYLSSDEDSPAVKAFAAVVEAVEHRLPAKGAAGLKTVNPEKAGPGSCDCGCTTSCRPEKCNC
jgi:hypothetical protein